jgi:hypothetical protein
MNLLINSNLSRFHAFPLLVLVLLSLPGSRGIGDETTAGQPYIGVMTLPIDLFSPEGTKIEKGRCGIEVDVIDGTRWILSFLPENKPRVVMKGSLAADDSLNMPSMMPLVGTHHMRSSSEPLKTAQERQFSKTGLPQYAEQERDWKATIRVYKNSKEPAEIFFIFQVRNAGSQPTRAEFKLRTVALDGKR